MVVIRPLQQGSPSPDAPGPKEQNWEDGEEKWDVQGSTGKISTFSIRNGMGESQAQWCMPGTPAFW